MNIHCPHCLQKLKAVELNLPAPAEDGSTKMRDVVLKLALKEQTCPHCGYHGSGVFLEAEILALRDKYNRDIKNAARRIANRDRKIRALEAKLAELKNSQN